LAGLSGWSRTSFVRQVNEILDLEHVTLMARYLGREMVEELKYRCCPCPESDPRFAVRAHAEVAASRWVDRPVPNLYGLTAADLEPEFRRKALKVDAAIIEPHGRTVHRILIDHVLSKGDVADMARFLGAQQVQEIAVLNAI